MVPSFNDSGHFRHASQWTFRFPSRSSLRDRPSFVRPPRFPILPAGSITYCVATASDIVLGFDFLHAVRRYFPFPLCRRGEAETGSSLCGHSTGHAGEVEEVNRRARNLLPQVVISHIPDGHDLVRCPDLFERRTAGPIDFLARRPIK